MRPVIFAHGLESSPSGTKANYLRERFGAVSPALGRLNMDGQIKAIAEALEDRQQSVLVGSSLGALSCLGAANSAVESIAHLVLLAPAVSVRRGQDAFRDAEKTRPGLFAEAIALSRLSVPENLPCTIIHGLGDNVVRWEDVVDLAVRSPSARLILVHDDHPLRQSARVILSVVEMAAHSRDPLILCESPEKTKGRGRVI